MQDYAPLKAKLSSMEEQIIQGIRRSVAIDSIKGEEAPGAPFGPGPRKALDDALEQARELGFETVVDVDHKIGYVEYGSGEEMVAVLGHLDVVPLGEGWTMAPFGGEIKDGYMYGRGTGDDKGPAIGALYGLKAVKDLGIPLKKRIRVIFGTDEESGFQCVKHYIDSGQELPVAGFTPDGGYPAVFAEKGMMGFTFRKKLEKKGNAQLVALEAGVATNVVPPLCTMKMKNVDFAGAEGIDAERQGDTLVLRAHGKNAHASTPEKGINAITRLFAALKDVDLGGDLQEFANFLNEKVREETNCKSMNAFCTDEPSGDITMNLGMLSLKENAIEFTFDIRYPVLADAQAIIQGIEDSVRPYGIEILRHSHTKPLYVPKDSPLIQTLMKVYEAETGDHLEPMSMGGGTYAKAFQNMVAFGPGFPDDEELAHQPDERIHLKNFFRSLNIITIAMVELAQA